MNYTIIFLALIAMTSSSEAIESQDRKFVDVPCATDGGKCVLERPTLVLYARTTQEISVRYMNAGEFVCGGPEMGVVRSDAATCHLERGSSFLLPSVASQYFSAEPCAQENTLVTSCGGVALDAATVAYGSLGKFRVKRVNGQFNCNSQEFGGDPNGGQRKYCYVAVAKSFRSGSTIFSTSRTWSEGGQIVLDQGASSSYVAFGTLQPRRLAVKLVYNGAPCTTSTFGDPNPGVAKSCYPAIANAPDFSLETASAPNQILVGVVTHVGLRRNAPSLVESWASQSGMSSTRDEMYWSQVVSSDGFTTRDGDASQTLETWRAVNRASGSRPVAVLAYGHPSYDGGGQPSSPRALAGYGSYAQYVANRISSLNPLVEVWNEWNLKAGSVAASGAQGETQTYVALAKTIKDSLSPGYPNIDILVGAVGDDIDWLWTQDAISKGLLSYGNGLSIHLYNHCMRSPNRVGADELVDRLDVLRDLVDIRQPRYPIYVTEFGWPTSTGACGVSEIDAAVHATRFLAEVSTRPLVRGVWSYDLQDDGTDPTNREHRFGLLTAESVPKEKPAACALRSIVKFIKNRPAYVRRKSGVNVAGYQANGQSMVVIWADAAVSQPDKQVKIVTPDSFSGLQAVNLCGATGGTVTSTSSASADVALDGLKPLVLTATGVLPLIRIQ